jgi:fructose-1,6-bisphosphatase I
MGGIFFYVHLVAILTILISPSLVEGYARLLVSGGGKALLMPSTTSKSTTNSNSFQSHLSSTKNDLASSDANSDLGVFKKYENNISQERKTFKRFMQVEIWRSGASAEMQALYPLVTALERACRDINMLMRRITTDNLEGLTKGSTVNVQGENQKKLDVLANNILKNAICCSGVVKAVASEEEDDPCLCSTVMDSISFNGDYAAVFDPLDGSGNIDSGLPTGTIFGIYKKPKYTQAMSEDKLVESIVKQRGQELVAAGYCLYSSSTYLAITLRTGLHIFTLDDVSGEFYLTKANVKIPTSGDTYSFNDAYLSTWSPSIQNFIQDFRSNRLAEETPIKRTPKARYFGALVADVHNILMNGGIFGYPGTSGKPDGKLRLVYEANPLALVLEEAGGRASNGRGRILDMRVNDIHQRTPLFIGSQREVDALEKYEAFYAASP